MDADRLLEIASGYRAAAVLTAAAAAGLLDALAASPGTAEEVAARLELDARAVGIVLNALVAMGVAELAAGRYTLPPEHAELLASDSPLTLAHILRHNQVLLQNWARLPEVLERGGPLPRERRTPEEQAAFLAAMDDLARRRAGELWSRVNLSGRRHLIDVGGGAGRFALEAVRRFPGLAATVVDLPESEAAFRSLMEREAAGAAVRFVAVDALEGPLPTADAALVSSLVHVFGPEELGRLAASLAAALEPEGLLVIRDFLFEDREHTSPPATALFAVNMLLHTPSGGCYTREELEAIFGPAGFGAWRRSDLDPRTAALVATRTQP